MRTAYDFTLPRGYVDPNGRVHRKGTMRLATARDELEPLRHPTVAGPDDPQLTLLVLGRVVESLGDLTMVSEREMEGLFAVDLAFLQDFYGVINFGTQDEFEALLLAQESATLVGEPPSAALSDPPAEPANSENGRTSVERSPGRGLVEEVPRAR